MKFYLVLGLVVLVLLVCPLHTVYAQESTPTPTTTPEPAPTPIYQHAAQLSSGNSLVIEYRISFGDIAVTLSVLGLIVVTLLKAFMELPTRWTHNR